MSAVLNQSNLPKGLIELLIPNNYKENFNFWEKSCTSEFDQLTLLHLVFARMLPNVVQRLKILNEFIPNQSWERMLQFIDSRGFTPLTLAMLSSADMDETTLISLIPKNVENKFWKLTINQKVNRTKGSNILHLTIINSKINTLKCLQILRGQMGQETWQALLSMKDEMLKETVSELARRLEKSQEIINELK